VLSEESLELSSYFFDRRGIHQLYTEHISAEGIPHGQRFTSRTVASSPPALEIHRPHVIARLGHRLRGMLNDAQWTKPPPTSDQTEPVQDASDGGSAWRLFSEAPAQHIDQFLRTPTRVSLTSLQDAKDNFLGRRQGALGRSAAPLLEAVIALLSKTTQPLVSRLSRHSKFSAQGRNIRIWFRCSFNKLHLQTHHSALLPGHSWLLHLSAMS